MKPERRFQAAGLRVERRAEGDLSVPVLVGHASVFDEWTTLYEGRYIVMREVVRPGAFSDAIRENQDVRSLFNHDPNFILGRTRSSTLRLREDDRGLMTETELLDSPTINDLVIRPIDRKDISGMSFAFLPRRGDGKTVRTEEDGVTTIERPGERITLYEDGDRLVEERELLAVDLFDISPVVYPAYEGTDVSLRSRSIDVEAREREARERITGRRRRRSLIKAKACLLLAEAPSLSQ